MAQPKPKQPKTPVPHWRIVEFVHFHAPIVYKTLERANVGRIYARAWLNLTKQRIGEGKPAPRWAEMADYLPVKRMEDTTKLKGHFTKGKSSILYGLVTTGRLPKDETAKQRLFDLAGYPWD